MHRITAAIIALIVTLYTVLPISHVAAHSTTMPTSVTIVGIQEGEVVTGSVVVEANVTGDGSTHVEFVTTGASNNSWTVSQAPYILGSMTHGTPDGWDTTQLANGDYTLTATAFDATGASATASVQFNVANIAKASAASASVMSDSVTLQSEERASIAGLPIPTLCTGIQVRSDMDVQGAIDKASIGATLCFQAGRYRLASPLRPKQGQTLQGLPGAVLNGAAQITQWQTSGARWVAYNMLPTTTPTLRGTCMPNYTGCRYPHDVFFDNALMERVMSLGEVRAGTFYADYPNNAIYIGNDPSGHMVEVARTATAISAQHSRTIIRGLTVEKFAPVYQDGAIFVGGSDSLVELNEARFNHGVGIKMYGTRITVRKNYAHHNGQVGITGTSLVEGLAEDNEMAYNNTVRFYNFDGEVGGGKWTKGQVTVRNNHSHHNKGIGLWFDVDSKGVLAEGNRVTDNDSDGIRAEISYDVVIRNNTITGNAFVVGQQRNDSSIWTGGGIVINTVTNVEITGNTLDNNLNGMEIRKGNRGSGIYGYRDLRNVDVHHNTVRMQQGAIGLVQHDDPAVYTSKNNRFRDNTYYLAYERQFVWKGTIGRSQWQAYGNDVNGTFHTLPRTSGADVTSGDPAAAYRMFAPLVINR